MTAIGRNLAQAYIDEASASVHCDVRRIMDRHFQRAHDEGVALARDAFLNMICDARRFEEDVDGDEVNGRTVITCDYHFTVEHDSLEELANALGIRRPIMAMENIGDAIWREINADIETNAAKAMETQSAMTEGHGPKDDSAARQGLPEHQSDTPS